VLFCTAHRLNNILKHTFYQNYSKEKKADRSKTTTTTVIEQTEKTPNKTTKFRTTIQASPEINSDVEMIDDDDSDTDESEMSDDDNIDYSSITVSNLPTSAKEILDTIRHSKALVKYTKKVNESII
jgi:hypothetical protein